MKKLTILLAVGLCLSLSAGATSSGCKSNTDYVGKTTNLSIQSPKNAISMEVSAFSGYENDAFMVVNYDVKHVETAILEEKAVINPIVLTSFKCPKAQLDHRIGNRSDQNEGFGVNFYYPKLC